MAAAGKSTRGGLKLRRCNRHSPSRKGQWGRTAANKRRRILRNLIFCEAEHERERCARVIGNLRYTSK